MKFSKSIVIFLFASSILGAFYYALNRTDGNVLKSLQFALLVLAIKIGLIAPNIPFELDHHQPNQQLVSRVQPLPVYNPYVSVLDDYRPSGLYMSKVERLSLVPQHYHSQKVIKELRAGGRLSDATWFLFIIWMLQQIIMESNANAFQPNPNAIIPPHLQWLYGNRQPGNHFGYGKGAGPRLQD